MGGKGVVGGLVASDRNSIELSSLIADGAFLREMKVSEGTRPEGASMQKYY